MKLTKGVEISNPRKILESNNESMVAIKNKKGLIGSFELVNKKTNKTIVVPVIRSGYKTAFTKILNMLKSYE